MTMQLITARQNLTEVVRNLVDRCVIGVELIQSLHGVHPIELKALLEEAGEHDLLERALGAMKAGPPLVREITREDNPVLHFWPFADHTAKRLAVFANRFEQVALLGIPTVFAQLGNRQAGTAVLFDKDEYFFGREEGGGFERCDLTDGAPAVYWGKFDLVIGDPPWYVSEYKAWLNSAIQMAKPGGTIAFVIFPKWVRESASIEREEILRLAASVFSDFSIDSEKIGYETPSFEQVQLIRSGFSPISWRRADLFTAKVPPQVHQFDVGDERSAVDWIERRVGSGRLFVNPASNTSEAEFLSCASPEGRFLHSPSMRDLGRVRANVLSSRGHGLVCSDVEKLVELVDQIHTLDDVLACGDSLTSQSREIFCRLILDLWPRFIRI